jgi:outer membrane lipoprotein-sorting protein
MSPENRDFLRSRQRRERKHAARPKRQSVNRFSWQMALSSCGLVLLLGLLSECSFADVSVNEILAKVSETYRGLQNYQLVADISEEVAAVGDVRSPEGGRTTSNFHQSTNSEVDLAAVNPGKVRLQVKDERREVLLVSDGVTTWTYLPRKKQYTDVATSTAAATQSRGDAKAEADILRQNQDLLVNRYQGLARFSSTFVLEKDNQIKVGKERVDCYVLKMETPDGVHEVWVDKNRFIVWRSKDSSPAAQEGITLQKTTTVNLKSANVNARLEDSLFTFTPPEKATKVQSLNIK